MLDHVDFWNSFNSDAGFFICIAMTCDSVCYQYSVW